MSEPRDRLSRAVDIAEVFARRRSGVLGVFVDEQGMDLNLFGSPVRRAQTAIGSAHARRSMDTSALGRGGGNRRITFGTSRAGNGHGRNLHGIPTGRENTPVESARRGRGLGVLPAWYPRTPLRDITAFVRAIERRRASLRGVEDQQHMESPITRERRVFDSSFVPSGVQLEHQKSILSPNPIPAISRWPLSVGKVPKILLDASDQTVGESEFLTPQKKLLKSIDIVEKLVMEELQKLKKTPSAKKSEREKKVRTLMSMR